MESKRPLSLVLYWKFSDHDSTIPHHLVNLLSCEYDEAVKQSLPLCVTEIMDLGAEGPSIGRLSADYWTPLYFGHLMKIIEIAEGNPLPLIKNELNIRTLLTYHTQFQDATTSLWQS